GSTLPADHPFDFDVPFEERTVSVDNAELSGIRFTQEDPLGLIFFLHGNGGNIESWSSGADFYQRVNYDMFMFDYRGYGKSTGRVSSQTQLHNDVQKAWDSVAPLYAGKPIVIYGRSLGAALAAELATHVDAEKIILVSPFTSMEAIAKAQYPLLPVSLVRYPLKTSEIIGNIHSPVILVHGDQDRLIPLVHSESLLKLIKAPSKLLVIAGAGHTDIHQFESYLEGLTAELPGLKSYTQVGTSF
ncbi:MAG: alpha/beta hydrolase, partial [Gammaproteobacteria bacterium]|nr:alpha/beta hydrolase [Gammaproteobacteria bacterium]